MGRSSWVQTTTSAQGRPRGPHELPLGFTPIKSLLVKWSQLPLLRQTNSRGRQSHEREAKRIDNGSSTTTMTKTIITVHIIRAAPVVEIKSHPRYAEGWGKSMSSSWDSGVNLWIRGQQPKTRMGTVKTIIRVSGSLAVQVRMDFRGTRCPREVAIFVKVRGSQPMSSSKRCPKVEVVRIGKYMRLPWLICSICAYVQNSASPPTSTLLLQDLISKVMRTNGHHCVSGDTEQLFFRLPSFPLFLARPFQRRLYDDKVNPCHVQ